MEKVFVIGGMGAGKSTASRALAEQGLPLIDLDKLGHEVLLWDAVKSDLRTAFGPDIFDERGEISRAKLALQAFASEGSVHKLNHICQPRIEELLTDRLAEYERAGCDSVVVEYSAFKGKENSLASVASCIVAIVAPLETRVARAVAAGWQEADVRARMARQISDAIRIEAADVVFENKGTPQELYDAVVRWWRERHQAKE